MAPKQSIGRAGPTTWGALTVSTLLLVLAAVAAADTYAERAARLESLTPEQRDDLRRKKERFDALPDDEKDRLRKLHESLSSAADSQELEKLMERYCNWLDGLESTPRAELLRLPPEERIKKIKEIVRLQESQRIQGYVQYELPDSDRAAIYEWLDGFVAEHEEQILDQLREDDRRRIRRIDDDKARRRTLITRLPFRRFNRNIPYPDKADIEKLVGQLSETTRKQLEKGAVPEERDRRSQELVEAAIWSIANPPPSEDELRKFYTQLPAEQRARLDSMDREKMQRDLRQMYRFAKFQEQGRGGPGPGGWPGGLPSRGEPPPGGNRIDAKRRDSGGPEDRHDMDRRHRGPRPD